MGPQEHFEAAERLLAGNFAAANAAAAHAHATLALAGFVRDAATGADHVHGFICGDRAERDTEPGRPV
jgi:hypothetical protein